MSAILIISIFLLVLASFAVFRRKRSSSQEEPGQFPPVRGRGLFEVSNTVSASDEEASASRAEFAAARETALRERAAAGDFETLRDASLTRNTGLYVEVLETLTRQAHAPETVRALCDFIARSGELRASVPLAEKLLDDWKQAPSRISTAGLLHIAALSDDASVFERVITTVYDFWGAGRVHGLTGSELRALIESEYWVLSPAAKSSGAGFVLKEKLAEVRRLLSVEARREFPPSGEEDGQPSASHRGKL
ncbi:MAG: hypothetical protein WCD76_17220 [Pyrinomonadaceae bacterium]